MDIFVRIVVFHSRHECNCREEPSDHHAGEGVTGEYLPVIFLTKLVINIRVRQGNQTNLVSRGISDENNTFWTPKLTQNEQTSKKFGDLGIEYPSVKYKPIPLISDSSNTVLRIQKILFYSTTILLPTSRSHLSPFHLHTPRFAFDPHLARLARPARCLQPML